MRKLTGAVAGTRIWTAEDDGRLAELYGTMPAKYLGKIMNRTSRALVYRAKKIGLPPYYRLTRAEVERIQSLRSQGMTLDEICKAVGRCKWSVRRACRKANA